MSGVTYDTGVLIAAERADRRTWARHRGLLTRGTVPVVPAPVLAQAWRGGARQAPLSMLLHGCEIESFTERRARATGELVGRAGSDDIVDGSVVESAGRRGDTILTADVEHIRGLLADLAVHIRVERI